MAIGDNRFVFIAPAFNAAETLPRMLHSLFGQSYPYWHLILIDDVSDADQLTLESNIIRDFTYLGHNNDYVGRALDVVDGDTSYSQSAKIVFIKNKEKKWEVANVLKGISMCDDDDIVCRIDADDALCDLDALMILNQVYVSHQCDAAWSMHRWGFSDKNISGPIPKGSDPYTISWRSSHLKTFRKRLINGISIDNFKNMDGNLVRRCGDQAIYLPVLKRAQNPVFVPRVLYQYTIKDVPETYQTEDARFQKVEADFIRTRGFVLQGEPWEKFFNV